MQLPAAGVVHAFRRLFAFGHRLAPPGSRSFPENPSDREVSDIDQKTTDCCRGPGNSSEIANRFVTHDFRAENPTVFWEFLPTGRRPAKLRERQRII
jgi:hypothetical protein